MGEDSTLGLLFEISADPSKAILATESFRSQAGKALKEFEEQIVHTMTSSLGITKEFALGMGVAVGAVAGLTAAMFELAHKSAEVGSQIYEASEKTGISASTLSAFYAAAKSTGESFDSLAFSLARSASNFDRMTSGVHKAHSALVDAVGGLKNLQEIGLKPADERVKILLERIGELTTHGERNRAMQELLGRAYLTNYSTIQMFTEKGIEPLIEKAKQLGYYFDDAAAAKARQFTLAWVDLKNEFSSGAQILGSSLIPVMNTFITNIIAEGRFIRENATELGLWAKMVGDIATGHSLAAYSDYVKASSENHKDFLLILRDVEREMFELAKTAGPVEEGNKKITESTYQETEAWKKYQDTLPTITNARKGLLDLRFDEVINLNTFALKMWISELKGLDEILKPTVEETLAFSKMMAEAATKNREVIEHAGGVPEGVDLDAYIKRAQALKGVNLPSVIAGTTNELIHQATVLRGMPGVWKELDAPILGATQRVHQHLASLQEWESFVGGMAVNVSGHYRRLAGAIVSSAGDITKALTAQKESELGGIIQRAIFRAKEQAADAIAALAVHDYWGFTKHTAAAVAYGALAATPIAIAALGSGGGGGGSGSGGTGGYGAGQQGSVPVTIAPGSRGASRQLQVIVVGQQDAARELSDILNNGVRYGGVQLTATHGPTGQGLD